jgi:hypothetical protein
MTQQRSIVISNLIEIKEGFGGSFRPYIVTEKDMNPQEILEMLLEEAFFFADEKILIREEFFTTVYYTTAFDKVVIVKQKPIPFERNAQ